MCPFLPAGLSSLHVAHIDDSFSCDTWPPWLVGATALTHLQLAGFPLARADAEAVVQDMRQLRHLSVKYASMEALELLQQAMPGLEVSAKVGA